MVSAVRGCLLVVMCAGAPSHQNAPLAQVPPDLPLIVRTDLSRVRAGISARIKAHNVKVANLLSRCGPGRIPPGENQAAQLEACRREQAPLLQSDRRLQDEKAAFAARVAAAVNRPHCAVLQSQLDRDRTAMERLTRTMEINANEVRDATQASLEAQKDIILSAGGLLLGSAARQMAARGASANAFKGWVTRHTAALQRRGVDVAALQAKIERAVRGYGSAAAQAEIAYIGEKAMDAADLFNNLKAEAQAVHALQETGDREMLSVLRDPSLDALKRDLVRSDVIALSELTRSVEDILSTATDVAKFGPYYTLGAFGADAVVNATKWWLNYVEIENQSFVLGQELSAMKALQAQIARAQQRLTACRAGAGQSALSASH